MRVDYLVVFGANLRQVRESREMTQADLAKRVGKVSTPYVSRVERGNRNITVAQCVKFARALGMPLEALFDPKGVR